MLKSELTFGLVGVVLVIGLLLYLQKNAKAVGTAAVGAVGDAAVGTVIGIGETVGIPPTNATQCQIDLANGDMWAASFSCDAATYISAVKDKVFSGGTSAGASGTW
ncbi:MAG: hypothetical protein KGJ21_10865 [Pseudomonadota bacterium]|nr:hypothetical protein [Pseudomonadota bacterium]